MTVGIAVALYNGEKFIIEQLDSIYNQTRKPEKVILCDDGSRDDTVKIVEEYITQKNLVDSWTLCRNEKNLGYVHNFYKAISLCDTDIVFLSDQDDIWEKEKIEKMTAIMEQRNEIQLLSCKYGIIDAQSVQQHSFVEPEAKETGEIRNIDVQTILKAYRWPGMLMCIRKDFFHAIYPFIEESKVAHDFMFAVCAADANGFYEYDYVGAYHRRHDNNTAREEHRVFKLLNLEKKLSEIVHTKTLWEDFLSAKAPVGENTKEVMKERLALQIKRKNALEQKSLLQIISLYRQDKGKMLRLKSFICDLWLVLFGKNV